LFPDAQLLVDIGSQLFQCFAQAIVFVDGYVISAAATVTVPTLVLHARDDKLIPLAQAKLIASRIANAKFVMLNSQNHINGADESAWQDFLREVDAFVTH
jgi:pimeloyl-ACP methyl ester carboxylesterase